MDASRSTFQEKRRLDGSNSRRIVTVRSAIFKSRNARSPEICTNNAGSQSRYAVACGDELGVPLAFRGKLQCRFQILKPSSNMN